jgi:hypothetical protein
MIGAKDLGVLQNCGDATVEYDVTCLAFHWRMKPRAAPHINPLDVPLQAPNMNGVVASQRPLWQLTRASDDREV